MTESQNLNITAITSGQITIEPFNLHSLTELIIVQKLNDHAQVRFKGSLYNGDGAVGAKYAINADTDSKIEIKVADNPQVKKLFAGILTNIEVRLAGGQYLIEAEAMSHSYKLDIKLKKRSFQDTAMTYQALVDAIKKDYPGAIITDNVSQGKQLEQFILQYNITDWEFLKQRASHFNVGLVPDVTIDNPAIAFGLPKGQGVTVKLEDLENPYYSVGKKLFDYRYSKDNALREITEKDAVWYEIESFKYLEIGDKVNLDGVKFVIAQSTATLQNGSIRFQYLLVSENGLKQDRLFNRQIVGVSLEGRVLKVEKDHVKLHLAIDPDQNVEKAYLFPYATSYTAEGNTGWYCMPEVGDTVNLYFPSPNEKDAVAIGSMRKNAKDSDKISDPKVKYFRTAFGKELQFNEQEIVITGKDGEVLIRLSEKEGIEIFSKAEVKINASKDVTIHSGKKVTISAGQEIDLVCQSSSIMMDGQTHIKGTMVKTNS